MQVITTELLLRVSKQARTAPRLRMNHNLHPTDESRCHRLLNAIEPNSYIRPHRHLDPEKDEAFILLGGRLGIITFSANGDVEETALLSPYTGTLAVDIPHGVFHTAVSLASGTVFYEAKAGPYRPLNGEETAIWAPEDRSNESVEYLAQLRALFQ